MLIHKQRGEGGRELKEANRTHSPIQSPCLGEKVVPLVRMYAVLRDFDMGQDGLHDVPEALTESVRGV